MNWNLIEFRELCAQLSITNTEIYIYTLNLKYWRATNFVEMAMEEWDTFFNSENEISTSDEEWINSTYKSESFAEASLQALHSMADVLAQIINNAVLPKPLPESEVSLHGIRKILNSVDLTDDLASTIEQLYDSYEFKYLNGFVNTIKHRRLLHTNFRVVAGSDIGYKEGLQFQEFDYNNSHFQDMWLSDILSTLIPSYFQLINAIGTSVNSYLRARIAEST